jgi:hypothetical protein
LNTPQFDWVKSRLPRKPQPVPPIYQPEVAAEAVVFAARNPRRELWVGASTIKAILSGKLAPTVGDWVLAREGYSGQQTAEPEDPDRVDNLWEPVPGDHGAHGRFDDQARARSIELGVSEHRAWFLAGAGAVGLLCGVVVARRMR